MLQLLLSLLGLLLIPSCASTAAPPVPLAAEVTRLATDMTFVEGPVWVPSEQHLIFSDIPRSVWMRWSESGGLEEHARSAAANGNALDSAGRLISCQHGARNVVRIERDGTTTVLADRFGGRRFNSPNDLAIEADGTIWFTDPPWGLAGQTEGRELEGNFVFRRDGGTGVVTRTLVDCAMPNGIALSPDQQTLYVADTGGHPSHPDRAYHDLPATLSAYAIDPDGRLASAPLWRVPTRCDGMCIDQRGNVYATGESAVTVWSPDGALLLEIPVPEAPANVCFGGASGRTLFITARTSLYAIEMDVAGAQR